MNIAEQEYEKFNEKRIIQLSNQNNDFDKFLKKIPKKKLE
jgi:hypothetical protein